MRKGERKGPYAGQLDFEIDPENFFQAPVVFGDPKPPEQENKIDRLVSFSDLEQEIYRNARVEPRDLISKRAAIGAAIDSFLVPANFIYWYRADYFFPEEMYPDWNLENVFSHYFPTGYGRQQYIDLLKDHRKVHVENNPLNPANHALERGNVKRTLIPLWNAVASKFNLPELPQQGIMVKEGGYLLPSRETASTETVQEIGQRIVMERFDTLVEDDPNYSLIAKPGCIVPIGSENLWIELDFIKNLRANRKSVKDRIRQGERLGKRIMAKRIVGDFKDTDIISMEGQRGPFAESMYIYNVLMHMIGRKINLNSAKGFRLSDGGYRRGFPIDLASSDITPRKHVATSLTLLKESGEKMDFRMPDVTQKDEETVMELVKKHLKNADQIMVRRK